MDLHIVHSYKNYLKYLDTNHEKLIQRRIFENQISKKLNNCDSVYIEGQSWTAQSESKFLVDKLYSNDGNINFRERLVCVKTNLNNRIRGCIHVFEELFQPSKVDKIYLTEQSSLLAKWIRKKYSNSIFSEYLSDCSWYFKLRLRLVTFPGKLTHQDLTSLTYKNNELDYVLSFDCLEHIPNYKKAIQDIYRVINSNGKLLLSVPFDINKQQNLIRASVDTNGEIKHFTEPEYHGDPISGKGCLSYYTFGWQLLEELKETGFKNVYIVLFWSKEYCYLGGEQILICAEK